MDHAIGTLTPGTVAIIPHEVLLDLTQIYPRIARALSHSILVDAATAREWMVRLGRRTAYERTAHLLCELWLRLDAVGLTQGDNFKLPVTQARLADALGLTPVHVNRILKQLRESGLITLHGGTVKITDWDGLRNAGEFTPDYLYPGQNSRLQRPRSRVVPQPEPRGVRQEA
jgi:CRP-like cAMP-binding protein